MKHLIKFEELDYSTYASAANKIKQHGQSDRATKISSHSIEMESKKIKDMSFDILVGPKEFPGAKFHSIQVLRESSSKGILMIFESGNTNTHKILATVKDDGSVVWRDYNKFANRRSVNEYQKALKLLANFQQDFKKMIDEMGLSPESLTIVPRTFYI